MTPSTRYPSPRLQLLCAFAWVLLAPSLTFGQDPVGQADVSLTGIKTVSHEDVDLLIGHGKQLEQEGRWGEALSHYQHALKSIPGDSRIKTRRSIARIHFDLARRHSDTDYLRSLTSLDSTKSLNLYAEVLLKIQSYYVDTPDWDNILRHGLATMEIALSDPTFLEANLPAIDQQRIQNAVDEMNAVLDKYSIRSRQDAFVVATNVCRTMNQSLQLPVQTSVHEFISGAVIALDSYSAFMTGSQYGETMSQIEGHFVGLGVELKTSADHLEIVNVIADGPAGSAGIVGGDRITAVDGTSVSELGGDRAADALRGVEGSLVSISIDRGGQLRQLRLRRRMVEIPSVEQVRIVDAQKGIGYIRLSTFQKTTTREFDAALWNLHGQGMRSLIVDVRGNPGGLLNASVEIADRFLSAGVIVSTRGRNPIEDFVHHARAAGTWRMPLVVLIDEDSASASEIFAAAIADSGRGTVVGRRSYGKGSVQGIFPLNVGGGGVRLTTAKFYSPNGSAISERGVQPQIYVQVVAKPAVNAADELTGNDDPILRAGLEAARIGRAGHTVAGK